LFYIHSIVWNTTIDNNEKAAKLDSQVLAVLSQQPTIVVTVKHTTVHLKTKKNH